MTINDVTDADKLGIRQRMKIAVKRTGRTIDVFCLDCKITDAVFYNKKSWPSVQMLLLISRECKVSIQWLMTGIRMKGDPK